MAEVGRDIKKAEEILRRGGLVAIPTETVYGLAANALNPEAVASIFEAKKRPFFDPLIIHFPDRLSVGNHVLGFPEKAEILAEAFWPGPLTLVLPRNSSIPEIVTSGLDTVGVRVPNHDLTRELLKAIDFPVAAPSANPFGAVSPTCAEHVQQQLGDRIDYILDGGRCVVGLESTIVGFENHNPVIYRKGGIPLEDIESKIGKVIVKDFSSSNPTAPGMLKSHYSPSKRLVIGSYEQGLKLFPNQKLGCLRFSQFDNVCPRKWQIILSEKGSLTEAAWHLFEAFRSLESLEPEIIMVEKVPDTGLGFAINDRITRASAEK
ncbi:MAG: L-threonylcarbamoyladenylate synthase [Cyclobacteriaceae bacterium]|nr:L-threonylcarbamoyladenylate synthase [Cyclobacteriaceae bacterium]